MKAKLRGRGALSALTILTACAAGAFTLRASDDEQLVVNARLAYYDLRSQGLLEFGCQVAPDWDALAAATKPDATGEQALPLARKIRFNVSVGPDGAALVSHQSEIASPNEQVAPRLRLMSTGTEQLLTAFFRIWAMFMHGFPVPDKSTDYKIEDLNGQYRIAEKNGPYDVVLLMNPQMIVTELRVISPELEHLFHPQFSRRSNGYLLTSADSSLRMKSFAVESAFTVDYQEVEGFELPKTVTVKIGDTQIALNFTDYHLKTSEK
jgi:hypothetical protein